MNKHTHSVSLIDGHIEDITDAEIKKALECCSANDCNNCPYNKHKVCGVELSKDAFDLINRQQAEIERLNVRNKALTDITKNYDWKFAKVKAEAIKEFDEKFKKKAGSIVTSCQGYEIYETKQYQISAVDFDNLVKEMTE